MHLSCAKVNRDNTKSPELAVTQEQSWEVLEHAQQQDNTPRSGPKVVCFEIPNAIPTCYICDVLCQVSELEMTCGITVKL